MISKTFFNVIFYAKKILVKLSIAVFYKKHIILKFFFFSVYPCICLMDPDLDLVPVIFYIDYFCLVIEGSGAGS